MSYGYVNKNIYTIYNPWLYGYNYVQLAIDYGIASSLYSLHNIYTIDVSTYQYTVTWVGAILNATILKIYLEITIDYETRIYGKNIT